MPTENKGVRWKWTLWCKLKCNDEVCCFCTKSFVVDKHHCADIYEATPGEQHEKCVNEDHYLNCWICIPCAQKEGIEW